MADLRIQNIRAALLAWYRAEKRDLPWRQTRDPYGIWVSEIMLQQTQVATVIPYYVRFLERFPSLRDLAEAPLDEVLKAWENLGYYSRARHLHRAAGLVMERGGEIPSIYDEFRALPGVGDYIAGAVLSIAFGLRVPAVDGNVRRVLSRVFGINKPVNKRPAQKEIQALAEALTPEDGPGDFNQALMELGARVCAPRKPLCGECPIRENCLALAENRQNELPVIERGGPKPLKEAAAALISDASGRWLLVRRPAKGLLGGLWKWPGGVRESGEALEDALRRGVLAETGLEVDVLGEVGRVRHAFTHFRLTLFVYDCEWMGGGSLKPEMTPRWCGSDQLAGLALSKVDRKILELAFNGRRGR